MNKNHRSVDLDVLEAKDLGNNKDAIAHSLLKHQKKPLMRSFESWISAVREHSGLFEVKQAKDLSESEDKSDWVGEDAVVLRLVRVDGGTENCHGQHQVATVNCQVR